MSPRIGRITGIYTPSVWMSLAALLLAAPCTFALDEELVLYATDVLAEGRMTRPGPVRERSAALTGPNDRVVIRVDQNVLRAHLQGRAIAEATLVVPLAQPLPPSFPVGSVLARRAHGMEASAQRTRGAPVRYFNDAAGAGLAFEVTSDVQGFMSGELENSGWVLQLGAPFAGAVAVGSVHAPVREVPALRVAYVAESQTPPSAIRVASRPGAVPFLRFENDGGYVLPFGVNYDHDQKGRLIETYWHDEWERVTEDFREMESMGFNLVRVHLQLHEFLTGPASVNEDNLLQLDRLVQLASKHGIYLNLTGLGLYEESKIPLWYRSLDDGARMDADAFFWEQIASRYRSSPSIFCYNLQNEPSVARQATGQMVSEYFAGLHYGSQHFRQLGLWWARWVREKYPSEKQLRRAWRQHLGKDETVAAPRLPAANQGKKWKDYVEFRNDLAFLWTQRMASAVRAADPNHMLTIGMYNQPNFTPQNLAPLLDFFSVHLYPEGSAASPNTRILDSLARTAGFGLPVVIEEFWPRAGSDKGADFLRDSLAHAAGWTSFYWGQSIEELWASGSMQDRIRVRWYQTYVWFGFVLRRFSGLS
jgi:hypothetical protein